MDRKMEKAVMEFISSLAEQYFENRDMDMLQRNLENKISWIGTGKEEFSRNLSEAKQALAREAAEYGGSFRVTDLSCEAVELNAPCCVIYGTVTALPEDETLLEENVRFTAVAEWQGMDIRLAHLHFSHADCMQEKGRYFVPRSARVDNESLRMALDARGRQLENLMENIPGGVHQCLNDPNLTLLSMSAGFLSLFGYTREEVSSLFGDQFINMVYPGDRANLLRTMYDQLQNGRDIEAEYRVLCKNGKPVWILDKGRLLDDGEGGTTFYCILVEIDERKREQEELRLSLERHQVIMDQATDIIFEWDIRKDALVFSQNWRRKFGYDAIDRKISNRIPMSQNIHPEDMPAFVKIMKDTAAGEPYSETEFRIRDSKDCFIWCRIRATTQYDDNGQPIKAVGVIADIDAEKQQKEQLLEKAQRDALTGLYNKGTINMLIEQRMKEEGNNCLQALLFIDIDHFKAVNDTYGHLCGDSILSDLAAVLKSHIRTTDLAGRIGGDEFIIYYPEAAEEEAVRGKIERLLEAVSLLVPEAGAPPITCSIGAAVFPSNFKDYLALYKCADQALYHQKNSSRGGYCFYEPSMKNDNVGGSIQSAVNAFIGFEEEGPADFQLARYAFHILYEATDTEAAMERLLEIIGRSYDVSRAYIFETDEQDDGYASMTFEWCNEGIQPQKELLQHYSYEDDLGHYKDNFDASGVFYCHDTEKLDPALQEVLAPQSICSMLQCAIIEDGGFFGGIGFDECRENRNWSQQQLESFKQTAHMLATFLVKFRLQQRKKESAGKRIQ